MQIEQVNIRAFLPNCTQYPYTQPQDCAHRDWTTEDAFPCGQAIHTLNLQIAASEVVWSRENLQTLAGERLEREGIPITRITEIIADEQLGDYFMKTGVEEAIKYTQPNFSPGTTFDIYSFSEEKQRNTYYLLYFRLPLPDGIHFTMMPLLFDRKSTLRSDLYNFLEIVDYEEEWRDQWYDFWNNRQISETTWERNLDHYYDAVEHGRVPDVEVADFFSGVKSHMIQMIDEKYQNWRQKRSKTN